jgi:hypothetical protein
VITALIRTHPGRETLTQRAIESVENNGCGYKIYRGETVSDYSYNLYCNKLKSWVTTEFFMFLDSDDYILPGAIEKIKPHLEPDKALIVQMLRNGIPKPRRAEIAKGKIGLPCMILHHSHKHLADITADEFGDWRWIYSVTRQMPWKFLPIPVVDAGKRGFGK